MHLEQNTHPLEKTFQTKKKILVIDDSILILKLVEKFLEKDEYTVVLARDATEAMDVLDSMTPDLILLDIILPDIDGYNLFKIIRFRQQTLNVPVVFVSSLDKGVNISKGLNLGAEDYIIKPFNSKELKNKLNRIFREHDEFDDFLNLGN